MRVGRRHRMDDHCGKRYSHCALLLDLGEVVPVRLCIGGEALVMKSRAQVSQAISSSGNVGGAQIDTETVDA